MVLVDINAEERKILLTYLKKHYGLYKDNLSDNEKEELLGIINKVEAIEV
jgi:hypothetical protein